MDRIKALDVMRGLTIAGMILVNNPGTWSEVYAPLLHSEFLGLTPTDLVFPLFMFIMGISTYISLRKGGFTFTMPLCVKIVRRSVVLFVIGLLLNLLIGLLHFGDQWLDMLRYMGVMQRLGICYGVTALLALTISHRYFPVIIAAIFGLYAVVLFGGSGFEFTPQNICCQVDTWLMGSRHLYLGDGWPFDPEGWLSTPSAVAHTMIGFCAGKVLMSDQDKQQKMLRLLLVGCVLMALGWLFSYGVPFCKKVWSPTFSLMTCGMAMNLLAMMIWLIDVRGFSKTGFLDAYGANPLFIFVVSEVMSIYGFSGLFHESVFSDLPGKFASLLSAITVVIICWAIVWPLYKMRIYIKL